MPANFENSTVATGLEKVIPDWNFIPIPKKGNPKECSKYHTIALISHTSKVMLKILQVRRQQYVNCEIPDVQAGFRRGRGTRDEIASSRQIIKKTRVPEKYLLLFYWPHQNFWLCGLQQTVENSSRDRNARPSDLSLEKSVCRSRSNSYYWTWNNRLVPNMKRSTSRLYTVMLLI